jgi:thiazole synthase
MEPLVIAGKAFQSRLIVGKRKCKEGAETEGDSEDFGANRMTD